MRKTISIALFALMFSTVAACGGGYSGFIIPQETALKPFVPPEDVGSDDISEEALEDYEDYEDDEGEEDDGELPAAGEAAPAPAAKPAGAKPNK